MTTTSTMSTTAIIRSPSPNAVWWGASSPDSGGRQPYMGLLLSRSLIVASTVYETVCLRQIEVCCQRRRVYSLVPKLWNETIEEHRREVREAILDTTVALVAEHGLLSVTMSQIAEETGIGRATLYKYFPDVEAILLAWHERQINATSDISPSPRPGRRCWRGTRGRAGGLRPHFPRIERPSRHRARGAAASRRPGRPSRASAPRHDSGPIGRGRKDGRHPKRRPSRRVGELLPPRPDGSKQPAVQGRGPPAH